MEYNTQQRKLPLPEYGRSVQNMVDHALTIKDRAERQHCANTIVNIMGGMFPHLRDVPDFKHKLWDHLAIMSDFKLDIDYPYEIVKKETLELKPEVMPYPDNGIRYRHYGRLLEGMIKKAVAYPEGPEKKQLIALLANQMKKCLCNWNKEGVEDQKVLEDFNEYTQGELSLTLADLHLYEPQQPQQRPYIPRRQQQNNNGPRRPHYNNNNGLRRKFNP